MSYETIENWANCSVERSVLTEFLQFLEKNGFTICREVLDDHFAPATIAPNRLIANFLEIDMEQLDRERRDMLHVLQSMEVAAESAEEGGETIWRQRGEEETE